MVYSREYSGNTLKFEPSGGLIGGSLVMQDKETNTYWSILKGVAVSGEMKGQHLKGLAAGRKMQWKDWVRLHPDTQVLSVRGVEDVDHNVYDDYFDSSEGFPGLRSEDTRLKTKEPVYSFHYK